MQEQIWDKEYKENRLVTLGSEPQASVKEFLRFLRKKENVEVSKFAILDLGSGTGRNSHYLASLGAKATGIEISKTALEMANKVKSEATFIHGSIGETFPFPNDSFDLILDVTSSNSLNDQERDIYLKETSRVLKSGGYFFVRALCKDGDKNAQTLVKTQPGAQKDTYIMPETGIIERVFSKKDFEDTYSPFFDILYIDKETHYTKMNNRSYKRNFWIAYLKKK